MMQTTYNQPNVSLNYANGGLDRYGRIINHSWIEDNQPLVHIIHGYDYVGNRTHRYDAVHAASSELYSYDAVNQIKSLQRGELDNNFETVTNLTFSEEWNFDKTGNWLEYGKNGTTQTRTANTANQILSINGNTTSLAHDANGNMLKTPKPDESGNHFIFKYDAWNRVTAVYESDGSTKVAEYFYNGLGHRIMKKTYVGGILTETRNYFYNEKWQCIEERVGVTIDRTYVWGTRGIDDLVMRERGEERLYPLTDPNNNVVAIIDSTGEVKERYRYDAFGKVTYLNPDFSVKTASQYDWDFLFTSRRLDKETGLMYYRNRYYHPIIGRFTMVDPLGYDAGDVNLYRYVNNQPGTMIDPMGLDVIWHGTWWYDGNRTWGDWGRGWIDWGYNTGSPVFAPTGIGEAAGALEAGAGIGGIGTVSTARDQLWEDLINNGIGTGNDPIFDEHQRRCELQNNRNP